MPAWKSAYLIHGDDHGRIGERRANLRALAERESGPNGVEVLENEGVEKFVKSWDELVATVRGQLEGATK